MMFSAGSYAKIWEIKEGRGNYTDIRISTSKKDRETGDYKQDFGGYVRMVGKAHEAMAHLEEKDSFKIVRCGVELSLPMRFMKTMMTISSISILQSTILRILHSAKKKSKL